MFLQSHPNVAALVSAGNARASEESLGMDARRRSLSALGVSVGQHVSALAPSQAPSQARLQPTAAGLHKDIPLSGVSPKYLTAHQNMPLAGASPKFSAARQANLLARASPKFSAAQHPIPHHPTRPTATLKNPNVPYRPSPLLGEMQRLVFGPGDVPPLAVAAGPLDAVFLWTNGSDPKISDGTNRAREWNELYYALKLFKANAVNFRRVLVVASAGVRPYYADEVKHWIEFVDAESFLPAPWAATRSSDTIQWHLESLKVMKNLTDPLVMLNDDWLVVNRFDLVAHANDFKWCAENWGYDWGYGNSDAGKDTFIESVASVNRAFRDISSNYRPGNILCHLPVVVRSRTVDLARRHFGLDQTHSLKRANRNLQFEYMLAQVEYHLLGAQYKTCRAEYSFVSMVGPPAKLKTALCTSLKVAPRKTFVCINDDIDAKFLFGPQGVMGTFKSLVADYLESLVAKRYACTTLAANKQPEKPQSRLSLPFANILGRH